MVNWSGVRDIYGDAAGIPALLADVRGQPDWSALAWERLWERLFHQGSVAPASYLAIPALVDIAQANADVPVDPALFLLASIVASTDGPLDHADVRAEHAAGLDSLRPIARRKLRLAEDHADFIYALQNVAAVEDLGVWQRELEGLANEEVELDCPACGDHIYLEVVADELLITVDPDSTEAAQLVVPDPAALRDGPESELVRLAETHGRPRVRGQLERLFSRFPCPACGERISVAQARS